MRSIQRALLFLPLLCHASPASTQASTIPPIHTATVTGAAVDLPAELHGKVAVLVMGFSQNSRDQVAAWGRHLAHDYASSSEVAYYQLAQLQAVPRLLRGIVTRKVIASVPERAHSHFIVITDHEAEWKQAASFNAADDAYILLIDATGTVRARAHGPATDQAWKALADQIQAALAARH